jgi:hypothetical protein
MLARGDRPTIGWYKRNYTYPTPPGPEHFPPKPAAAARLAFHMVLEGYETRMVARAVYDAATAAGMSHDDAIESAAVGIARAGKPAHAG